MGQLLGSGGDDGPEEVRPEVSPGYLTFRSLLDLHRGLSRNLLGLVEPVPNVSLLDAASAGETGLAAANLDCTMERGSAHTFEPTNTSVEMSTNRFGESAYKIVCTLLGMKTLSERLTHARALAGISQSELARRIGVKPQSIQAIESGRVRTSKFTFKMAKVLGVPPEWLDEGKGEPPSEAFPDETAAELEAIVHPEVAQFTPLGPQGRPEMIPIRSAARGGNDQLMFMDDPVGYTRRPSNLEGIKDAYAIYMVGDSMSPRYEPGWLLHVNPHKPPKPGRCVVVEKRNGAVMVKLLASRRGGVVELRSINSDYPDPILLQEGEIRHLHVIVGSDEEG